MAPRAFLQEVLEFAASYDLIVASDEAYSEIYFGEPPLSMLNVSKERVLAFNSLSKRSAMTCYRVGWVAGDPDLVDLFRQGEGPTSTPAPRPSSRTGRWRR